MNNPVFSLAAIILAAGRATRMGRPKMLMPWGSTTIVGQLIHCWQRLGAEPVAVVCAAKDSDLQAELDRLSMPGDYRIENPDRDRGMFSSILCAAHWEGWGPGLTHWAIILGDQPHVRPDTLSRLLDFAKAHPSHICQPRLAGRPKHPVVLPRPAFHELARTTAVDLKHFLAGYQIAPCDCEDPGLNLDIDRPEDYLKALALAGFGS